MSFCIVSLKNTGDNILIIIIMYYISWNVCVFSTIQSILFYRTKNLENLDSYWTRNVIVLFLVTNEQSIKFCVIIVMLLGVWS